MNSVIEDLWYGNISMWENCGAGDKEIEQLVGLMSQNEEILRKELTQKHAALFSEYASFADKYSCYISAHAFRDGFSLACKLLTEALLRESNQFG